MNFLLDTNVVSEPVTLRPRRRVIDRLRAHGHDCAIAAPVWHELVFGMARLPASKRRSQLERYLEEVVRVAYPILAYGEAAAAWHASERAHLERTGRVSSWVDGQIAAIAASESLVLATANPRHFTVFRGLSVQDWTRP